MIILSLPGCTPEPLMSYLKALGVLRVVSEQADPAARAFWREGTFTLRSSLDAEGLVTFFRDAYAPTSVFSPWNGDGGFLTESGSSYETKERVAGSLDPRLARLRPIIQQVQAIDSLAAFSQARQRAKVLEKKKKARTITPAESEELKSLKPRIKELKEGIIFQIRNQFPESGLDWLDACLVISANGFSVAPVLGSGGVDGRLEFSTNFLANVLLVTEDARSAGWLRQALFEAGAISLVDTAIGQFAPGRIGGPNATQGMEGSSLVNPWDYVLMIEGSLFLGGSVSRKLGVHSRGRASFPFTVGASAAGNGSLSGADSNSARGELWLPLWERWASVPELKALFAEGRAELRGRQSRDGVEFARAVASLGVDRGIHAFSRHGFLQRNGLAFLATPLGRFPVQARANVDLLREADPWLASFRAACSDKTPARYSAALRGVDRAVFDYCRYGGSALFQEILVALGRVERAVAAGEGFRTDRQTGRVKVRPLGRLSAGWLTAAADPSAEFALALALAGVDDANGRLGPLRVNLEPVAPRRDGGFEWAERGLAAVWNGADLTTDLLAVLGRRQTDHARLGGEFSPFAFRRAAPLHAVARFLAGETDDARIDALLAGLVLLDARQSPPADLPAAPGAESAPPLPRAYALLKLVFHALRPGSVALSSRLERRLIDVGLEPSLLFSNLRAVQPEPTIPSLLRAGRVPEACRLAMRRLRAKGLTPMPHRVGGGPNRDDAWQNAGTASLDGPRLAAALLFPVSAASIGWLCLDILRPAKLGRDSSLTLNHQPALTTNP